MKGTKTLHRPTVEVMRPLAEDLAAWREVARAEPDDLVCPALGRADREPDAEAPGRFLHLGTGGGGSSTRPRSPLGSP